MGFTPFTSFLIGVVGASGYFTYTLRSDIYQSARVLTKNVNQTHDYVQTIVEKYENSQQRLSELEQEVASLNEDKKKLEFQLQRYNRKLSQQAKRMEAMEQGYGEQIERVLRVLQLNDDGAGAAAEVSSSEGEAVQQQQE